MVRAPEWGMYIIWYFFLGGIAGGAYFMAAIADNFGGRRDREVAKVGYFIAFPLVMICGVLLILDLGMSSRFLNMVKILKFWNPMSLGAWAVGVFGAFSFACALLSLGVSEERLALRRNVAKVGSWFGFFLAAYTGVLLSNTAQPIWRDARLMGALFLASGASTGLASIALISYFKGANLGESWSKLKKADTFAMVVELALLVALVLMLGPSANPIIKGSFALPFWGGLVVLGLVVPLGLSFVKPGDGKERTAGGTMAIASVLILIGGFLLRYVVIMAGQL
ncbi:MAG: polysulfide reductase NrfD [candidate division NC10 bacterium]|nr:polysulfide reductase NrfD [candidate division NC10 bacterium]